MINNKFSQSAGFEPARGDPIGFQVQRLNHSATAASYGQPNYYQKKQKMLHINNISDVEYEISVKLIVCAYLFTNVSIPLMR